MINFFIKEYVDDDKIIMFLSDILELNINQIIIQDENEFGLVKIPDKTLKTIKCLCVKSFIQGDAKLLIQAYNINCTENNFNNKVILNISKYDFSCYLPFGDFDDYIYVTKEGKIIYGIQDDGDNGYFNFLTR